MPARKIAAARIKYFSLSHQHSADVLDDASRRRDPVFMQVLETLTRAWAEGRMVHLTHQIRERV
jgi:hypothetical protein